MIHVRRETRELIIERLGMFIWSRQLRFLISLYVKKSYISLRNLNYPKCVYARPFAERGKRANLSIFGRREVKHWTGTGKIFHDSMIGTKFYPVNSFRTRNLLVNIIFRVKMAHHYSELSGFWLWVRVHLQTFKYQETLGKYDCKRFLSRSEE